MTTTSSNLLHHPRYPRSNNYDPQWVITNQMGPNPLWLVEALSEVVQFKPGMRVLDLGCGTALTSIFLAQEFGVRVWATDLWIEASANLERIRATGVEDLVVPIHAEAHALPFAADFFDAIVSVDAYHYFGTDDLYLGYIAEFLKEGGEIAIAVPGLVNEVGSKIPEELIPFWEWDFCSFHSPEWWREHWQKTGKAHVNLADSLIDGWKDWLRFGEIKLPLAPDRWKKAANDEVAMLRVDKGEHLGFSRIVATKGELEARPSGSLADIGPFTQRGSSIDRAVHDAEGDEGGRRSETEAVDLSSSLGKWHTDGFALLPRFLSASQVEPGIADLGRLFPTADEFHGAPDKQQYDRFRDEFGGIDDFPFNSTELNLLAVHEDLVELASSLLGTEQLRVYSIEAWAKYTGAADYSQHHHRDYLSQTMVVPSLDPRYQQVEMFLYLSDVPPELGPPSFVPRRYTRDLPAIPNWFPLQDNVGLDQEHPEWIAESGMPGLYDAEVSAAGPAGTVVAYANDIFHRGTALSASWGARYTIHVNFRPEGVDWISRHPWQKYTNSERWHDFVLRATPKQLALFGFPPPGHPYWTKATIIGTAERYPGLDLSPWRAAMRS